MQIPNWGRRSFGEGAKGLACSPGKVRLRRKNTLASILVVWYIGTRRTFIAVDHRVLVERVQTGVRMEKRILKVLKAFAEFHDLTLGDLLEGIVLHAFDGKTPFGPESLRRIKELRKFYGLELDARASHPLIEGPAKRTARKEKKS